MTGPASTSEALDWDWLYCTAFIRTWSGLNWRLDCQDGGLCLAQNKLYILLIASIATGRIHKKGI